MHIGIIGAGAMGKGIAKNLKQGGYEVLVYKRVIDEQNAIIRYLQSYEIPITTHIEDMYRQSEILITCLPDSPTVESILLGPTGLIHAQQTLVQCVLDFSTAHPKSTKKIAAALDQVGIGMLDTPMTGGPVQADEGKIRLAVGGKKSTFETYRSILEPISEKIVYAGESGNGNIVKLVNNFLAILSQTATAGVAILTDTLGIPREAVYDYISVSGGNSWGFQMMMSRIMQNAFDVNFSLALAYKDLRYSDDLFASVGGFPLLDTLINHFHDADLEGFGDHDVGAIYHSLINHMGKHRDEAE
jgi:3-hydroxyisobutyrate dehydrogenase